MKKVSNIKDTYKINDNVTATVVNKREEDTASGSIHYARTVTLKINAGKFAEDPLLFDEPDALAKYVETVSFVDPNETLDLEDD